MSILSKEDKHLAIQILSDSFQQNPSVNWVIKNDLKRKERIHSLAEYAVKSAALKNGVFLSSDKSGVAVCYENMQKKNNIMEYVYQTKLVINSIGIRRVLKVLKRELYIAKIRPLNENFLYFWFFGVLPNHRGNGAAKELKESIFALAREKGLPIYLETSVFKNKKVYERYGFEVYHLWDEPGQDIKLWFMRKSFSENRN